jgi:hypothetical protein
LTPILKTLIDPKDNSCTCPDWETRSQNWPVYNAAQEAEGRRVPELLAGLCSGREVAHGAARGLTAVDLHGAHEHHVAQREPPFALADLRRLNDLVAPVPTLRRHDPEVVRLAANRLRGLEGQQETLLLPSTEVHTFSLSSI